MFNTIDIERTSLEKIQTDAFASFKAIREQHAGGVIVDVEEYQSLIQSAYSIQKAAKDLAVQAAEFRARCVVRGIG